MTAPEPTGPLDGHLDDDDYPAYTMGRAAEMLGTTQGFLRAIGEARLITPLRSAGGHRRYSHYQLRIAARARELVDQGTPNDAGAVWDATGAPTRTGVAADGTTRTRADTRREGASVVGSESVSVFRGG
ncbi:MerR family transcriptional regulator [Streptomyces sp. NPDC059389]|uniref:MerR family transcriptional regulator n=1 Tax=Streptomyces sp. NPDC059389 TaxID=3346818 RepID=UPI0036A67F71